MVRWHGPSTCWIVARVCSGGPTWPAPGNMMRIGLQSLSGSRVDLHTRLRGGDCGGDGSGDGSGPSGGASRTRALAAQRGAPDPHGLLQRLLSFGGSLHTLGQCAAVDRAFSRASMPLVGAYATARLTRELPPMAPMEGPSVEMLSPRAADLLPLLAARLSALDNAVEPHGGAVHAFLVEGPVLFSGQGKDLSCAYRSAQMILSYMLDREQHAWPAARHIFIGRSADGEPLDGSTTSDQRPTRWRRHTGWQHHERRRARRPAVPSVERLQRAIVAAWRGGYDQVGAEQLSYSTVAPGGANAAMPRASAAGGANAAMPRASAAGGANAAMPRASAGPVAEYAGVPVPVPGLALMGASDIWAPMRWVGTRAELHDFIDGPDGQRTSAELLFEWVWSHLRSHAPSVGGRGPRVSRCAPIYLQWAGHAVCIVGACRRQMHSQAAVEKHLLIFNPEHSINRLLEALEEPEPRVPIPFPLWWRLLAHWSVAARKTSRRITLAEATSHSEGNPSGKGPGGENGPYQTMVVPLGWETRATRRAFVRSPEDACTQHIGDEPPQLLARFDGRPAPPTDPPWDAKQLQSAMPHL